MLKASIVVVLVAYAAVFALTGMPQVEAAPAETPDAIDAVSTDAAPVIQSEEDLFGNSIKFLKEVIGIGRIIAEIIQAVSPTPKPSQSVGEVEAAPTGLPDILGLGNIDKWVIDSAEELIDEIIKLIPENFDINNSILGAIKKILDQIPKDLS